MSRSNFNRRTLDDREGEHDESACGGDDDHVCAAKRAGLPLRAAYDLNAAEIIMLDVARCILSTYSTGDAHHWDTAINHAEVRVGVDAAGVLAGHVTSFIRALRRERRTPFKFLSFGCTHISYDEIDLISALQAAELGSAEDYEEALSHLTGTQQFPATAAALRALSQSIHLLKHVIALRTSRQQPATSGNGTLYRSNEASASGIEEQKVAGDSQPWQRSRTLQ